MKRKPTTQASPKPKRQQVRVPDYCDTPTRKDHKNETIWPAPAAQMQAARDFFQEWSVYLYERLIPFPHVQKTDQSSRTALKAQDVHFSSPTKTQMVSQPEL